MTVISLTANNFSDVTAGQLVGEPRESSVEMPAVLRRAIQEAKRAGLGHAGNVSPEEAWKLFVGGHAHLIDVRTLEEREFTGYVPNTLHITWPVGPVLRESAGFIYSLKKILPANAVIIFICRSGRRSAAAAAAATQAEFSHVFNVREGTDGDRNDSQHQRQLSGWRQRGLPWLIG